jgi:branched-chain amino acid transport system permease protein
MTLWLGVFTVIMLSLPFFVSDYVLFILTKALMYVLVAMGFNLLLGFAGQLVFANVAFFGIGAYSCSLIMMHLKAPFLISLFAGAIITAVMAMIVCLPALRGIKGLYLAIITLAFGELMRWIYIYWTPVTQGAGGFSVPTPYVFGVLDASNPTVIYITTFLIAFILLWAFRRFLKSKYGRGIIAARDNPYAAESVGVNTRLYLVMAFGISGFYVGVAGGIYAAIIGRVVPDAFGLPELLNQFGMVIVGGLGSFMGSIIGGVALSVLPDLVSGFPGFGELIVSVFMLFVLLFMPKGLVTIFTKRFPQTIENYYRNRP